MVDSVAGLTKPVEIDLGKRAGAAPAVRPFAAGRPMEAGRGLMTILNGGRMSRYWLMGLGNSAVAMGLRHFYIEIDQIRAALKQNASTAADQMNGMIVQNKIGAVLNYTLNASTDLPVDKEWPGAYRNYWEVRGIPQFYLWADHPQWAANKNALGPEMQAVFRSGNQFHFFKSGAHAYELNRVLGWPNCHEVAAGADPEALKPATGVTAEFDVVAIFGTDGVQLPGWLEPFLEQDDPDPEQINLVAAGLIREELTALWEKEAPMNLRAELGAWSERAIELKLAQPKLAMARHLGRLADEFPAATWWLVAMFPVYFKATTFLYRFRDWQRHFLLAYLSKYFRVGLFGGKWSHVGSAADQAITGQWVDFAQMPAALARGKIAANVVSGWDEEGLTAKTFEIASCGMAMIHNDCVGLREAFEVGKEVEMFQTPREARLAVGELVKDEKRRHEMGEACRARVLKEHTWGHRLRRMFELARVPIEAFGAR